jgi:Tfp pilus assembly protein PilN
MKTHLNLLPWRCRRTQLLWLRLRQWLWPCCIAAAAGVICLAAQASRYAAARQRLEEQEREYLPLESLDSQIAALKGRVQQQTREIEAIRQLEGSRPALTLLGLVSQCARDCQGQLQVESLSFQAASPRAKGAASAPQTANEPSKAPAKTLGPAAKTADKEPPEPEADSTLVTIRGVALDNLSAARFIAALRQTKAFRRVDLKSTKEQPMGATRVCSWMVECGY